MHLDDEMIARALAGELPPAERTEVLSHTQSCITCHQRLDQAGVSTSVGGWADARSGSLPGARFGRYVILDELGVGGMGAVYSAYDPELDRRIAIKVLHPFAEGSHPALGRARLLREAQAMARLSHPHVISVYDVATVGERVFFAMEQVDGGTLRAWLGERRTWREVVAVFLQAGRGLAAAHAAQIVHRDFKPENVLMGNDGRVRVTDFGVARATGPAPEPAGEAGRRISGAPFGLTHAGQIIGTPGYMAPEQLDGRVDASSDQFSFCVALFEALTGRRPFAASPFSDYAQKLQTQRVEFPAGTEIPRFVREVVLRGLEKDPARRFASMEALLEKLGWNPTARRVRLGVGIGLAAVVAVTGGWALLANAHQERTCAAVARRSSASWTAMHPEVAAAFRAAGKSYAADALRAVQAGMETFMRGWGEARQAVCRGSAPLPKEQLAASAGCLDQAEQVVDEATRLLARGESTVIQHAAQMVAALPAVEDCFDLPSLLATPPPPADPQAAAAVAAAQARLERARILGIPWPQEGIAAVQAMFPDLERMGSIATLARAHFVIGEAEVQANLSSAEQSLQKAAELALEGRDDRLFVRAAGRLAHTIGRFPEQRGRAADWMDLARGAYRRAGSPPALTAWLELMQMGVFAGAGRWDECARSGVQAVEAARREGDAFLEAEAVYTLAYCRENTDEPEKVLAAYDEAVARYTALVGPDHPDTANAQHSLVWARRMSGDLENALSLSEKRLATDRRVGQPTMQLAAALGSHAQLLSELGREQEALAARREALEILERVPHNTIASITLEAGLASSLRHFGDKAQALHHASEAVAGCAPEVEESFVEVCAMARFTLAQILFERGQRAAAALQATRARQGFARLPVARRLRENVEAWGRQVGLPLP